MKNKPVGGVYAIRNTENRSMYIGAAAAFRPRWQAHRTSLRRGAHHNPHLQRDWNVYGEAAFIFEILEEVQDPKAIAERETYWIQEWQRTGIVYNATLIALGLTGEEYVPQTNIRIDADSRKDASTIAAHFNLNGMAPAIRLALREMARRIETDEGRKDTNVGYSVSGTKKGSHV